jgi:hypothetical protein
LSISISANSPTSIRRAASAATEHVPPARNEQRLAAAARAARVEAEPAVAKAKASDDEALIAHQRLQISKLTRQLYGQRSERRSIRLLDQMELAFAELESSVSEGEIAAERAVAKTPMWRPLPARSRRVSRAPRICRASGWSSRHRRPARAAAAPGCASWARTSPKSWK